MAERRIAVTRAAGRRRLRRVLVVLGLVALLGAAAGVVVSPLLDVDRFAVVGADDRVAEVVTTSGIERGTPILLADTGSAERRIAELPWVGSVRVARALPGTVRIVVEASVPVAWMRAADGSVAFLDARARVQVSGPTVVDAPAAGALPELAVTPPDPATTRTHRGARGPARVAASLGPLAAQVASISVSDGVAVLRLRDTGSGAGPEIRFGSLTRLSEKARAAAAVLAAPGTEAAAYLDVSVPAAPVTG